MKLSLDKVARRLDGAGITWAVFAGAAATVCGVTRPLTDVEAMMAYLPSLDWEYLRWRAEMCVSEERSEQILERLETLWNQKPHPSW